MKRDILVFSAAVFMLGFISVLQAGEMKPQRFNLDLWGNGLSTVNGHFSNTVKSMDFLQTGASFGIAWQYFPMRSVGIQAGYELSWQNVDKQFRNEANKTPAFVVHQITLSGLYNFANVMESTARFRPYVGAGIGLYPFRLTDDGVSGNVVKLANGKKFEKTSFGLNGNAGLEFRATDHLSVFGGARYHYLFSKDDNKFGADSGFGNQGLLSYGLGLAYHFPFGR
ncbi:MAG: opacity family porin [candidate division KSB1 bacterium]|nr:opacity family porin [candidate division KSB1 bacterium]MDZ7314049.1 opacity family porin [candidate division KSB1 bacterium]